MLAVKITELGSDWRDLLKEVRAGEEIVISYRNETVAKIIPFPVEEDHETERQRLAAQGILKLGKGGLPPGFLDEPVPKGRKISVKRLLKALDDDREEN